MLFFLFSGFILSYNKDGDNTPSGKSHKVQFKIVASAGSDIQPAVYGVDEVITAPAGTDELSISSQAIGADANSASKVQIYVDGALKKEGASKGEIFWWQKPL